MNSSLFCFEIKNKFGIRIALDELDEADSATTVEFMHDAIH